MIQHFATTIARKYTSRFGAGGPLQRVWPAILDTANLGTILPLTGLPFLAAHWIASTVDPSRSDWFLVVAMLAYWVLLASAFFGASLILSLKDHLQTELNEAHESV